MRENLSEELLQEIISQTVIQELENRKLLHLPGVAQADSLRVAQAVSLRVAQAVNLRYVSHPRQWIMRICRLIYTRQLSDAAGGNVSLRIGDNVYITPRYMGEHHQWEITPDDIILAKIDGTILEGEKEKVSREGSVHFSVYRNFKEVGGVIHAHPANCLVFACSGKELPSVTAMMEHFCVGTVPLVADAPPGSDELAREIIEVFKKRSQENKALVVLVPNHGVVVAGKDLAEAYVILESVETNARVFLMKRLLS